MHRSPSKFVLLLMAAPLCSFFLAHALQPQPVHLAGTSCLPRERDALLAFKRGIIRDGYGLLASWQQGGQDCCWWRGVTCSNVTGHVIELDLHGELYIDEDLAESFEGQISPSLLSLEHLEYLDLSYTSLTDPNGRFPEFLSSLKNLRHLGLSQMFFSGRVPPQLGNLSKLEYLSLYSFYSDMYSTDISWLTRLPLLFLDLSSVNLSKVADWPLVVNMIPSLEQLQLERCSLPSANQSLTHLNLTNLQALVLSGNYFDHPIAASWFWNVTSIKYLDLSGTYLYGPFPSALGRMTSLQYLYFGFNGNTSTMMVDLKNLCDLEVLHLDGSLSSGNITEFIENLPQCPSNKLQVLGLFDNSMFGKLPNRMGHLTSLTNLDLSNNHLTGALPPEIANCTSLMFLYLSNNHLTGQVPSQIGVLGNLTVLDLSYNNLEGVITEEHLVTLQILEHLDLSHNSLSGPLPIEFRTPGLLVLTLSSNYFTGHIPESFCKLQNLLVLDLSNNLINGELPHCSHMPNMAFLLLSRNSFSGKFPSSLQSYSSLAFLDLAWNNFNGTLPVWIGDLVYLRFLQLSHNMLYGDIPVTITNLKRLHHLNLAGNSISGAIPWSLSKLTAMTQKHPKKPGVDMSDWYSTRVGKFGEVLPVVMKGQELKYGAGIFHMVGIDLSLNHLTGGIPDEITSLNGLLNLNLTWNHLNGKIPEKIGAMKSIESLDLSRNNLSSEIPPSLSDLTYLSYLDLSYNNLTGRIPQGRQLDTLYTEKPSMYNGNIGLCGPPLERNCSGKNAPEHGSDNRSEKVSEPVLFFYFGLGSGYVTGLWVVFCALLFKKAWRAAYFSLFDKLYDNAYVFVLVTWGRITSKATTS